MKILKTKFKDLLIIKNQKFFDNRGSFREVLIEKEINKKFLFTVVSISKKNVIRGLHYQKKNSQGKFVTVIKGKILDVVVDIRKNSKTFGKQYKVILSEKNCTSIYVPPGFAHGFACLGDNNIVLYSCTQYRNKNSEHGILWNDEFLKIKWNIKKPIISEKDKRNPKFKDRI
tara:strand:+ start:375 stop:890 length:516 start_codon:yes stop_codon:yes gene_type:complete